MTKQNNYFLRLGLNGSKLVWRVLTIVVPMVFSILWVPLNILLAGTSVKKRVVEHGLHEDGTPEFRNITHIDWPLYYGDERN
jgi:hypothetical protein